MRVVLLLAGTVALLANLLMPQQLVHRNACCLPQASKPAHACCGMGSSGDETSVRAHRSCCDPITMVLRSGPTTPGLSSEAIAAAAPLGDLLVAHSEPMLPVTNSLRENVVSATGPPVSIVALYQLHAQYLV